MRNIRLHPYDITPFFLQNRFIARCRVRTTPTTGKFHNNWKLLNVKFVLWCSKAVCRQIANTVAHWKVWHFCRFLHYKNSARHSRHKIMRLKYYSAMWWCLPHSPAALRSATILYAVPYTHFCLAAVDKHCWGYTVSLFSSLMHVVLLLGMLTRPGQECERKSWAKCHN